MAGADRRRFSLIAGWAYLVIIACGLFAEFGVRQALFDPDAGIQSRRIAENHLLFRVGILSDLVMLVADVIVAWALYVFFLSVDRHLSMLAAFFRLVQASVIGAGLIFLKQVLTPASPEEVSALILAHGDGYRIGLVFFGACCVATAALALRSREVPKAIGILILLAGVGYLADTVLSILMVSHSPDISSILLLPAFVGEIAFCVWLIGWGGRKTASD